MATVSPPSSALSLDGTAADLLRKLGRVSPRRVRLVPAPGTATEKDVIQAERRTGRLCELIDGTLVEKVMGAYESAVAGAMIYFLKHYLRRHRLGVVLGADGLLRILPRQVRIPDVAFLSWKVLGGRRLPREPILGAAPDLAVEVLSKGNTKGEMARKLRDYFAGGVRLVWFIDPRTGTAKSYTAPDQCQTIGENGVLSGGEVLPGFKLALRDLFAEAEGSGTK
jgi:Uma2 family endonuclease